MVMVLITDNVFREGVEIGVISIAIRGRLHCLQSASVAIGLSVGKWKGQNPQYDFKALVLSHLLNKKWGAH